MSRLHSNSVDADTAAWGGEAVHAAPNSAQEETPEVEIDAASVIEKEKLVKELVQKQDGLKALVQRIADVHATTAKLKTDNEMLQTYIDNLTRNNALGAVKR